MSFEEYLTSLQGKTVGVIGVGVSNRPLIEKLLERGIDVYHEVIDHVMTKTPRWIDSRDMAVNALQIMSDLKITGMPVLNEEQQVVGTILMQDIFKAGIVR